MNVTPTHHSLVAVTVMHRMELSVGTCQEGTAVHVSRVLAMTDSAGAEVRYTNYQLESMTTTTTTKTMMTTTMTMMTTKTITCENNAGKFWLCFWKHPIDIESTGDYQPSYTACIQLYIIIYGVIGMAVTLQCMSGHASLHCFSIYYLHTELL